MSIDLTGPGFYGKLPVRGDFIGRRLGRKFIDAWDGWLGQAIHASRVELGDTWLNLYLSSPIWRFALSADACGPDAVAGVMIPSVDSVGRYFPLMVGRELGPDTDLSALIGSAADWYGAIEQRALLALEPDFTLDRLEAALDIQLSIPRSASTGAETVTAPGWQFPAGPADTVPEAARECLRRARPPVSIWWTDGSQRVAPVCLVGAGLPLADAFASMLDGNWRARGWLEAEPDPGDDSAGGGKFDAGPAVPDFFPET